MIASRRHAVGPEPGCVSQRWALTMSSRAEGAEISRRGTPLGQRRRVGGGGNS